MNLPSLPLIDGCLFIDNSGFMEGVSTCSRYLQYKTLNLRVSAGEKSALNFGSAIHLALEHRYRHYKNQPVDQKYYDDVANLLTKFFEEHPTPGDDWRSLNFCMEMVRKYNEKYESEEFNLLVDDKGEVMVELAFALPLFEYRGPACPTIIEGGLTKHAPIPVIYTGRIDLPISLEGSIYVMDHKTSSQLGGQFWKEMKMTAQMRGYVWAFQELTGKKVSGFMVNGLRTKEVPKYVESGKTYSRGGKSSTAESWWGETFQRERFILKPGEIDEWKRNTIDLVEEFFFHYFRDYMPLKTKWCNIYGQCPYYDVCTLAEEDRGMFLASGLFTDNIWSPLKQPTQSSQ